MTGGSVVIMWRGGDCVEGMVIVWRGGDCVEVVIV